MKVSVMLYALVLSLSSVMAQSYLSTIDPNEQYMMLVVSTSYSALACGTAISIYSPEAILL